MLGGRSRRSLGGSATAVRITAILTAVGCCLAAAAYATVRSIPSGIPVGGKGSRPLRPLITVHPDRVTTEATAQFDLAQPRRPPAQAHPGFPLRYECRLDTGGWEGCTTPIDLGGLDHGIHRFAVRAVNRAGNASPIAAYVWRRKREPADAAAEPPSASAAPEGLPTSPSVRPPSVPSVEPPPAEKGNPPPAGLPFTIEQIGTLADLLPGAPAQLIEMQVDNPNPTSISITSITAKIANEPPGCPAVENFVLTAAAVSPAAPLVVPAETVVTLPEAGVAGPTIAMVNLPFDQGACEADELEIDLSGEAIG